MSCQHARLAQLRDPTHTEGIRERFLRDVQRRFRALRGVVRKAVGYEDDVFNLAQDSRLAPEDDIQDFPREDATVGAFVRWLEQQIRDGVLEPVRRGEVEDGEHWTATYVRAGYRRGVENAQNRLQNAGLSVSDDVEAFLQLPTPKRQLRRLFTRVYDNYEDITSDMVPQIRRTLTRGVAEGINPREMARELTQEIRSLQHTRAETLARTEVIHSYSEATLDRYDRASVDGVTVSGEFSTADDERVCPICEAIEGTEFAIDAMRSETFEFEPSESEPDHLAGEYPVKPPVHPQCRCAILPVIE